MDLKPEMIKRVLVWEMDHYYNVEIRLKTNLFSVKSSEQYYSSIHFNVEDMQTVKSILSSLSSVDSFLLIKGCCSDGEYERKIDTSDVKSMLMREYE